MEYVSLIAWIYVYMVLITMIGTGMASKVKFDRDYWEILIIGLIWPIFLPAKLVTILIEG